MWTNVKMGVDELCEARAKLVVSAIVSVTDSLTAQRLNIVIA